MPTVVCVCMFKHACVRLCVYAVHVCAEEGNRYFQAIANFRSRCFCVKVYRVRVTLILCIFVLFQ